MDPLTSAWTERHTWAAVLVVVVAAATAVGVLEERPVGAWVAAAVIAAAIVSLVLDALGSLAVGFLMAALLIAARRATGAWTTDDFVLALVETAGVVVAAVVASRFGSTLRDQEVQAVTAPTVEPAFGSLGLLDADLGMLRLEEEVERARAHRRPLTLAVLQLQVHDDGLDAAGRTAAARAVARLLESRVRDVDVPFALARDRLAVILPETDATAALERVGAVLDGISTGRFASRGEGVDRRLADAVEIHVGTARLDVGSDATTDHAAAAGALLDAAAAGLQSPDATDDATGTGT